LGWAEESFYKEIPVFIFQYPGGMLLNGANCGFVRMLNHEVGKREALDPGGSLNAPFLFGKKAGFCSFRA
jgi:hypothetical protein